MTFKEKRELLNTIVGYQVERDFYTGMEIHEVTVSGVKYWYDHWLEEYNYPKAPILIPDDMAERFLDIQWEFAQESKRVQKFYRQSLDYKEKEKK